MMQGFARIKSRLDEEALDFGELAKDTFRGIVEKGSKSGWLVIDPEA